MTPEDLADAAESYVLSVYSSGPYLEFPTRAEVHEHAARWSFDGWRAVARRHNPDFDPHYEDTFQAVEILRQRAT